MGKDCGKKGRWKKNILTDMAIKVIIFHMNYG